jgi:hypothetical protein
MVLSFLIMILIQNNKSWTPTYALKYIIVPNLFPIHNNIMIKNLIQT